MKNSFKNLTLAELKAKRDELNRKYMELRFQIVIGHVDNPLQKRVMRRQISRLNTLIHQQESPVSTLKLLRGDKSAPVQKA